MSKILTDAESKELPVEQTRYEILKELANLESSVKQMTRRIRVADFALPGVADGARDHAAELRKIAVIIEKMAGHLVLFLAFVFMLNHSGSAQTKFLGPAQPEAPRFSAKYGIPYFANGFETAIKGKWKQAKRRGQSKANQDRIRYWGQESKDERFISTWIDEGFDAAKKYFSACPGERGRRARALKPSIIQNVTITETIFYLDEIHTWAAGATYPDNRIKVVGVYAGSTGDWRHAQSLLRFEAINAAANVLGVKSAEAVYQVDACVE